MISVKNKKELEDHINSANYAVPSRDNGRKSEHVETYMVYHLLEGLLNADKLKYPLCVTKMERPDFLIKLNGVEIGVEMTEATSEDYSKILSHVSQKKLKTLIELSRFKPENKLSKKEMKEISNVSKEDGRLTSSGWVGSEVEKDWYSFIQSSIQKKEESAQKEGFKTFPENWLYIYDNTPTVGLIEELALPYLEELKRQIKGSCFQRIFIQTAWCSEQEENAKPLLIVMSKTNINYIPFS